MGKADLLLGSTYIHTYIHSHIHTRKRLMKIFLSSYWEMHDATSLPMDWFQHLQEQEEEGRNEGRRRCVLGQLTNYWEWMNAACMHASVTSLWKSRVLHPAEIQVFSVWNSLLGHTTLQQPSPKKFLIIFTLRVVVDGLGFWWGKNLLEFFLVYLEV